MQPSDALKICGVKFNAEKILEWRRNDVKGVVYVHKVEGYPNKRYSFADWKYAEWSNYFWMLFLIKELSTILNSDSVQFRTLFSPSFPKQTLLPIYATKLQISDCKSKFHKYKHTWSTSK